MSDTKKKAIKSFFSAHYGSGSGSESESEEEQDVSATATAVSTVTGGSGDGNGAGGGEEGRTDVEDKNEHQVQQPQQQQQLSGLDLDDNFSDDGSYDHYVSAKEFHESLRGLTPDQIKIPKRNKDPVDSAILEQLERLQDAKEKYRTDMKYEIQKRKDFRNPSIYEKLIDHCNIQEFGSNFPTDIFDPDAFAPTSYYEELSKAQQILMDTMAEKEKERELQQTHHPKVEIIHATVAKKSSSSAATTSTTNTSSSTTTTTASSASHRKRSKWDEGPSAKRPS